MKICAKAQRGARAFLLGFVVLASCFHGPPPVATLAPALVDSEAHRSRGPFSVVYAAPRGRVADRKQPGITVLFSRAIRSVDMRDDENLPAVAVDTKAGTKVKGSWRWTGTRGLLFTPEGELPGGSDFRVTVPPDVRALDGSPLGKPYLLDLETAGPTVVSVRVIGPPGVTEHAMPSDVAFQVEFDQSVEPGAVAAATLLSARKADGDRGETIKLVGSRPSPLPLPLTPSAGPSYAVVLKPEKPLPFDHQIELSMSKLQGVGGPRLMEQTFTQTMRTHGPLRFVDFYCPRIQSKGRCRANGDVKVVLSNPVRPDELKSHVRLAKLPLRPPPKAGAKAPPRRIDPATDHWLGVAPKLGEQYKVTLVAGMRDIYGQKLERDATFDLVVEAPLVNPPVQQVEAAEEPQRHVVKSRGDQSKPRREKLPYQLDLGLVGHVFEAAGTSRKIPIGSVNIPTYARLATSLSDAQAIAWLLSRSSTPEFLTRNALRTSWTTVNADVNERAVEFIDLDAVLASKKGRGPALVVLTAPGEGTDKNELLTVTDLGVTAKLSPFGGLIWITHLSSGKPVSGASVSIRTAKGGEIFEAKSDGEGLVVVPIERFDPIAKEEDAGRDEDSDGRTHEWTVRSDAAIVVKSGDDWTITKVAASPVEHRLASDFQLLSKEGRWAGMLFADRGVFRPGETAKVAGIVRVVESGGLRTLPGRELRIQLKDGNSEQIFDGRAKCDEFGTFSLDVKIPKTAPVGTATIVATAPPGGTSNTSVEGDFRHEIRILEFKPNEFKVAAESDKPWYVRGDSAIFTTRGDYLFGAPMQNASVTTTVSRQEVPFVPKGADGFSITDEVFTGDYADTTKGADAVDTQDGTLDAGGMFTRTVPLAFDDQRRPERVVFDAEVQDLSRNTVSARSSVVLHPGEFYVGLRAPKDRFIAAGTALTAEVAAIEPNGGRRAQTRIKIDLVERSWNGVTFEQPDGKQAKASKPVDTVISSCDAVTGTAVGRCDLRVPHAGYFIVRATAKDPRGNTVRASMSVYGTEDAPRMATAWATDDRHEIKLEANKKMFDVGESARVVLRNPFREAQALVTVERNGVLWRRVVSLKGAVPVVEIPVLPEFYPNAFVSVVALRGRVAAAPAMGTDAGGPEYRFGWTELHVNEEAHRLSVSITQPKAEYAPGATVEADVLVRDRAGKPIQSALTFYVVDEGVLALTNYVTPDPLPAFVKRRKLRVFSFDSREGLARIVPMKAGERLSPLGYEYALSRNPGDAYDKGDDGGDGGSGKRAEFRTTAFFEAGRKTDREGKAHFSFKLPDNLTTFRIMAVAAGAGEDFGSGESKVTTFRKLMARPALPRILRVGDALEASVIVTSKSESKSAENVRVDVRLDAKGVSVVGSNVRNITMPRGGQSEVRFPVKALARGEAELSFDVRSGSDVDKVVVKRRVDLPLSVESTAIYGEITKDSAIALGDLRSIRKDYGGLELRLSSSALVGLGMTFDRLNDYPYGCTEQLTSRLLPMVATLDLSKDVSAKLPADGNAAIDAIVETLLKRQNSDGGFGFWDHSRSEPWLSAYAMLAISGAAEKKRFVPHDVLEQGRSYLKFRLADATRLFAKGEADKSGKHDVDVDARAKEETKKTIDYSGAALIGDTLATLGVPNPGALNILYDARVGQRLFAQASLLHAMVKSEMSSKQIKAFAAEIEGRLRVGPSVIDVDEEGEERYGVMLESRARTLAAVLRALLAADPKHPYASRMVRQLLAYRQPEGSWRNTQEDGWALLALADYRRLQESSARDFEARAFLEGDELMSAKFPKGSLREDKFFVPAERLAAGGDKLSFDLSGDGPLFYSASLKYATALLPKRARDDGLFVTKYLRGVTPASVSEALRSVPKRTVDAIGAGDLVLVDLLFESAEPRTHVVLDDPLPAGLEALDYDLETTSKAARDAVTRESDTKVAWLGTTFRAASPRREVRDDRVVHYFESIEPGMYRVTYLARATSLGTFVMPPTRIEAMYSPEIQGRTAASALVIRAPHRK